MENKEKTWILKLHNNLKDNFHLRIDLNNISWIIKSFNNGCFGISNQKWNFDLNTENNINVLCDILLELKEKNIPNNTIEEYLKAVLFRLDSYESFKVVLKQKIKEKYKLEEKEYNLNSDNTRQIAVELERINNLEYVKYFNTIRDRKETDEKVMSLFDTVKDENILKKMLQVVFEEKNVNFIEQLYKKHQNFDLDERDIKELLINACRNTDFESFDVVDFLFRKYSEQINSLDEEDIKEIFITACKNKNTHSGFEIASFVLEKYPDIYKKENFRQNYTPIDVALENFNQNLVLYLLEYSDSELLDLVDFNKKQGLLNCLIYYEEDISLFGNIYWEYINDLIFEGYSDDYISKLNCEFIKRIYLAGKTRELIDNIDFSKISCKDFNNLLVELLKEGEEVDIKSFNHLMNIFSKNYKQEGNKQITAIVTYYKNCEIDTVNINSNQIKIDNRKIIFNKKKRVEKIIDAVNHIITGKKLYEVSYNKNGANEIIYYEEDGITILATAKINENNELIFEREEGKGTYNQEQINKILNDDYKNKNNFDPKLSYLSFATLKDENIIFKVECYSIESIINIIRENNPKKTYICEFCVNEHEVQLVINGNNLTTLNTGECFGYVAKKIKEKCEEEGLNINIEDFGTLEQNVNNCVEASKLYTYILVIEYKKRFEDLSKLSERLNNFKRFMYDFLGKSKEEQEEYLKNELDEDTKKLFEVFLETNKQLLDKEKVKHFKKVDDDFEKLQNILESKQLS